MFVRLVVIALAVSASSAAYNGPLAGGLPAAQYPAGVSPQACPNYPNCDNPAVAVNQVPVSQYSSSPQYNQPQYQTQPQQYQSQPQYQPQYQTQPQQYQPVAPQYQPQYNAAPVQPQYPQEIQNALDRGEYIGDGDYHGEGLAEALAPGYQAQPQAYNPQAYAQQAYNQAPAGVHQLPAGVGQPAQVPAGVDARACPNYPFCQ